MLTDELLNELHRLNRSDKLRVVQLLVNELAAREEEIFMQSGEYEVWSPEATFETISIMEQMLRDSEQTSRE